VRPALWSQLVVATIMCVHSLTPALDFHNFPNQWRTQKIFMGGWVHSVAYGGHFHLVCAVCDVTI